MIIEAIIALILLGIRCNMAKYCAKIISAYALVKLNFYSIGVCGLLVLLLSATGMIKTDISLFMNPYLLKVNGIAGVMYMLGDTLAMLALSKGMTGPASAILSFTAIIVSILAWVINKIALTPTQLTGIFISLLGVIIVSTMGHSKEQLQKS